MSHRRVWWLLGGALTLLVIVLCLVPTRKIPEQLYAFGDKFNHVLAHFALATWFAGLVPRVHWWRIFLSLAMLGIGIEYAQHLMQVGREGDVRDVFGNVAGAALGLLAARLGLHRWPDWAASLLGRRATP